MAGQRLMVGIAGKEADADARRLIEDYRVGGVILFSRNLGEPDQVRGLCSDLAQCAREAGLPPLFIAVDQEGGQVARLAPPFTQFPGNPFIRSREQAEQFAKDCAADLLWAGFNMNMAPVLDVPLVADSIMADRAFSPDPGRVSELGTAVIEGLQRRGVLAVAKHFPGIGRTTLDSHVDLPTCQATAKELKEDLLPFAAAVAQGVAGVMLSHIVYPALDETWPASMSPAIARDLLRDKMGYNGLVLTDDLDMGAIARHFDVETAADQALAADVDLVLICKPGPSIGRVHEHMARALEDDPMLVSAAQKSMERMAQARKRFTRT
ncbi:MAG: beta-N-acetylhexosaminidase [Deltaproteobacteria bacterium]|nr:beta-N-acetylhexosaminidase [Deltaproteobacteria bacterium]